MEAHNLLYFAHGEHMNEGEMLRAFPHARMAGLARLEGYALSFVGRDGMARAALEPRAGASAPGRVWVLQEADADMLDRLAGDAGLARREICSVVVDGMHVPALAYVTAPGQQHGRPGFVTYDILREAYDAAGEDTDSLRVLAMHSAP